MNVSRVTILMADDDADDCEFTRDALLENGLPCDLRSVSDGEELMDYLLRRKAYAEPGKAPRPGLILLDLNMPRKDGREALKEIKRHPSLQELPIVVLTTSSALEDLHGCYRLGASSFITKPSSFSRMVEIMRAVCRYWLDTVSLPVQRGT